MSIKSKWLKEADVLYAVSLLEYFNLLFKYLVSETEAPDIKYECMTKISRKSRSVLQGKSISEEMGHKSAAVIFYSRSQISWILFFLLAVQFCIQATSLLYQAKTGKNNGEAGCRTR